MGMHAILVSKRYCETLTIDADHCIELLRQSVMCNANQELFTFHWIDTTDWKPETIATGPYRCMNWDRIREWTMQRAVPVDTVLNYWSELSGLPVQKGLGGNFDPQA